MSRVPLNIFQKLMRRWDRVHPYNAAQAMQIASLPNRDTWGQAWQATLNQSGLGAVACSGKSYNFVPLNGQLVNYPIRFPTTTLCDYISAEINRPFDDPAEPPFRPFVISDENHFFAGVVYQHWLADSASIRMLMREWFVRVYDPYKAGAGHLKIASQGYWDTVGPGRAGWGVTQSILDMTRRHVRLRRVQKIDSTALADHQTRFELIPTPPGLITHLREVARRRQVKVNDIFLAALMEACAQHVPLQPRPNRRDVAVGSVVDLRPCAPPAVADQFGLFLGFTNVICQPDDLRDFDRILVAVAKQTRWQKTTGVAPASLIWMAAAMVIGTLSKPGELYHFYRKELPLAGGVSNVDLTRTWAADYHPSPLMDYIRVSPTGPMTPLAITTTTLGERFHIGMTYRTGLISKDRADALANTFLTRLQALG